ncbi:MAG TPA: hypothetical protein P5256_12450, partial [Beijerinckiaceae bacterium]|nr:hypothetical protein [Beijerinckiaceae bacterium]
MPAATFSNQQTAASRENAQSRPVGSEKPGRLISQPTVIAATLALDVATVIATGSLSFALWYEGGVGLGAVFAVVAVAAAVPAVLKSRWAYTIPALSSVAQQLAELALALFVAISAMIVVEVVAGVAVGPMRGWALHWFLFAL